jgi:hypothetical protein
MTNFSWKPITFRSAVEQVTIRHHYFAIPRGRYGLSVVQPFFHEVFIPIMTGRAASRFRPLATPVKHYAPQRQLTFFNRVTPRTRYGLNASQYQDINSTNTHCSEAPSAPEWPPKFVLIQDHNHDQYHHHQEIPDQPAQLQASSTPPRPSQQSQMVPRQGCLQDPGDR